MTDEIDTVALPNSPGEMLSPRTGEPVRVWTIWVAAIAGYLTAAVTATATVWIYWDAVRHFSGASRLMGLWPTELASTERVLLAVGVTVIALLIAVPAAITGYYAWDGRRWTRWTSLVALALSVSSLLLNPLAWFAMGFAAAQAMTVWLPASKAYFDSWATVRGSAPELAPATGAVFYGPLPRYR